MASEMLRQELLIAEPILQSQQHRIRLQQGRNQVQQGTIGSGFQRNDHQITGANVPGRPVTMNLGDAGIPLGTQDLKSMRFDLIKI
jgi:hypothetical protein